MITIDKIVQSDIQPKGKNILWLNTNNGKFYTINNGKATLVEKPGVLYNEDDITCGDGNGNTISMRGLATALANVPMPTKLSDLNDDLGVVRGTGITNIRSCTLAEYDTLATHDANTFYVVKQPIHFTLKTYEEGRSKYSNWVTFDCIADPGMTISQWINSVYNTNYETYKTIIDSNMPKVWSPTSDSTVSEGTNLVGNTFVSSMPQSSSWSQILWSPQDIASGDTFEEGDGLFRAVASYYGISPSNYVAMGNAINNFVTNTVITEGITLYYGEYWWVCLLGDTLVTLSDGITKCIKDLEIGDEVKSLDLETGEVVSRKVIYTDATMNKSTDKWDEWVFSDGTIIKTAHRHEFYNVEAGKFKYLDEWQIGEHTYKENGTTPQLIDHIEHVEEVNHYKITLEGSTNYFANGLLTGDRNCNIENLIKLG